jgi:lipopolysaccharide biosynthesis regulator YciM
MTLEIGLLLLSFVFAVGWYSGFRFAFRLLQALIKDM